jgi:hypothetical protein
MKKIILPGLAAGIGMLGMGFLMSFLLNTAFPELSIEYQNPNLFRPWSDPLMSLFYLHPFVLGIVLAFVWERIKGLFTGTMLSRGFLFGFMFWIAATVPGMFISYSSFPISLVMIASWTINGLVQALIAGLILAKMNK